MPWNYRARIGIGVWPLSRNSKAAIPPRFASPGRIPGSGFARNRPSPVCALPFVPVQTRRLHHSQIRRHRTRLMPSLEITGRNDGRKTDAVSTARKRIAGPPSFTSVTARISDSAARGRNTLRSTQIMPDARIPDSRRQPHQPAFGRFNARIEETGYKATGGHQRSEAVEAMRQDLGDLVLMDCQMPVMGRIPGHPSHSRVDSFRNSIIAFTGERR